MDLTQLANLGEFIGGVAVLVTLVYLAVQVRQGEVAAQAGGLVLMAKRRRSHFRSVFAFESFQNALRGTIAIDRAS